MHDIECPYCAAPLEINHDDGYGYEEDCKHEQQCGKCGKNFVFTTAISFHHEAEKADCLNGAAHNYKLTHTFPPEFARMRCECCGDEKPRALLENVADEPRH